MSVQIYGSFKGYFSFPNISRAIVKVLQGAKIPVSIYDIVNLNPIYEDIRAPVGINNHAPVSVIVAYPTQTIGWLQGHKKTVLVTVCESSRIPGEWVAICRQMTTTIVPSAFCANAFQDSGVRDVKIIPHGIDDTLLARRNDPIEPTSPGIVRLLHVSGAVSFPPRKGTPQLLYAMKRIVKKHPGVRLYLKMSRIPALLDAIETLKLTDHVSILDEKQIEPRNAWWFYRQFDAIIQPSRGEGFGICPLEARACGVPAILTNATGHMEHFVQDVDIEIETSPWTPLRVQGNEGGMAPGVSIAAVENGIEKFLSDIEGHKARTRRWARDHASEWTWSRSLKPLVDLIKPWTSEPRLHKLGEGYRGLK